MEVYDLWKNYHLNNFHAGTKAQEDLLKEAVKMESLILMELIIIKKLVHI